MLINITMDMNKQGTKVCVLIDHIWAQLLIEYTHTFKK